MLWHYLGTALHNLRRHRLATLTHILGLALGLSCFVLSFTFIESLREGEPNLPNADRTFVLTQDLLIHNAAKVIPASPYVTLAAYDYLRADFPQLEAVARAMPAGLLGNGGRMSITSGDKGGFVHDLFVDPAFLKTFHLKVLAGDANDPFKGGTGAVITERAALRIFGTRDVLGRRVLFSSKYPAVITAVIADVAQPSHLGDSDRAILQFDFLTPMDVKLLGPEAVGDWTSPATFIYLVLPANGSLSVAALRASLKTFGERHMPASTGHSNFDVVPVSQVRRIMMDRQVVDTGFSIVTSLYTLDALVLIVACFNYANLATALALRRAREIALRKIVGAKRRQLVLQCLIEAGLVGVLALIVAVAMTLALIPLFNVMFTQALRPTAFVHARMWVFLAGLIFSVVMLAGVYPAWTLSRLQPVRALRATSSRTGAGRYIPRALIGLQFMATGFLVIMLLVVQGQNHLMRAALVGIARNPTLVVTTPISDTPVDMRTLRARLLESPAVESVTTTGTVPWSGGCCWVFIVSHSQDPAAKAIQSAGNRIGVDYFQTVGLKLLAGRTFRPDSGDEITTDDFSGKRTLNVVIDQELARQLGYASPAAALNASLFRQPYLPRLPLRVIGVVESAANRLTDEVGSRSDLYLFTPKYADFTIIRFRADQVGEAVAHLEKTWKALAPGVPLERSFMDQRFEDAYATFGTVSALATALTVCAFIIALMGLFGMAVQVTNGRLREIGVRKTLGAKSRRIFTLLLLDFSKPVVLANLIAWPFATLAARAYLGMFFTPMHLSPLVYLAGLASTVVIATAVVCGQSWRAARAQPAEVLRYE
ncbi:MAG TPA: FtsX-like permease family protein [Steroidobacteraceae bacterium]|nr:FtsX-like permease family protein [Steroidobacteraceae bacterium]